MYYYYEQVTADSHAHYQEKLFLGDYATGNIISVTDVDLLRSEVLPMEFSLNQNYPNPFNPATTIEFSLPAKSHVRLEVYSLLGERVATLVDGEREAGMFSLHWTATVPSGLYFYRLEATPEGAGAKSFTSVRKMMVLK
jgi:hypothetical protein